MQSARAKFGADGALARFAAIVESADDAIISKNLDGIIESWNPAASEIFGYRAEEAIGRPITLLIPPTHYDEEREILARIRRGQRSRHYDTVRIGKDGHEIRISLTVSPLRDSAGDIIGAAQIARDVTLRRRVEEELTRARKLESIGLLAGGIAHDFNNLFTGLFGNVQLARMCLQDVLNPLAQAEEAFKRAQELTHRLITFSRGGAPIRKRVRIADLLRGCLADMVWPPGITTEFDASPALWPTAVDEHQMAQVITNLLANAQEAMPEGGRVCVSATNAAVAADEIPNVPAGDYVAIRVVDTGVGIAEEHLPVLFDPFFTTKAGATGLGLSVVYSIVHRHGGHVTAQSVRGGGTTLIIYLPADAAGAGAS